MAPRLDTPLSRALLDGGKIDPSALEDAIQQQLVHGGALDTILLELGLVDEKTLAKLLAQAWNTDPVDPGQIDRPDAGAVRALPERMAIAMRMCPVFVESAAEGADKLHVLVPAPLDRALLEEVGGLLQRPIVAHVVPEVRLWHGLARAYGAVPEERFVSLLATVTGASLRKPTPRISEPEASAEDLAPAPWDLVEAFAHLAAQDSRDGIVKVAARFARKYLPFVALFGVRGARELASVEGAACIGWVRSGPAEGVQFSNTPFSITEDCVLAKTLAHPAPFVGPPERTDGNRALFGWLGRRKPRTLVVVPIVVNARAVGALVADGGVRAREVHQLADVVSFGARLGPAFEALLRQRHRQHPSLFPQSTDLPPQLDPLPRPAHRESAEGAEGAAPLRSAREPPPALDASRASLASRAPLDSEPTAEPPSLEPLPTPLLEPVGPPRAGAPSEEVPAPPPLAMPTAGAPSDEVPAPPPLAMPTAGAPSMPPLEMPRPHDVPPLAAGDGPVPAPPPLAGDGPVPAPPPAPPRPAPRPITITMPAVDAGAALSGARDGTSPFARAYVPPPKAEPPLSVQHSDPALKMPSPQARGVSYAPLEARGSSLDEVLPKLAHIEAPAALQSFAALDDRGAPAAWAGALAQTVTRGHQGGTTGDGQPRIFLDDDGWEDVVLDAAQSHDARERGPAPVMVLPSLVENLAAAAPDANPPVAEPQRRLEIAPPLSQAHAEQRPLAELVDDLAAHDANTVGRAQRELVGRGAAAVAALAQRFPGRLVMDPFDPTDVTITPDELGPLVDTLAQIGEAGLEAAIPHLDSRYPAHRFAAVLLFAHTPDARAIDLLRARLHDQEPRIQKLAADALAPFLAHPRFESVLMHLRERLNAPLLDARRRAVELAGAFRDVGAVPSLVALLGQTGEQQAGLHADVRQALRFITLQDHGEKPKGWDRWWAKAKKKTRVDWLLDGLHSEDRELRAIAGLELAAIAGDDFGFHPDAKKADRKAGIDAFTAWWADAQKKKSA